MSYLVNPTRPVGLTIGNTDYINNLVSFQCSDTSSYRNGLITTTGTIILGTRDGESFEDYDRNDFKRGQAVHLEITFPDGTTATHPRGRLHVISTSYNPESEQVSIEVACRLALLKLIDDDDDIKQLLDDQIEIPLDPAQQEYESLSSSIAAATKIAWVDSTGTIQKENYFGNDNFGEYEPGSFVSVRGVTALEVQPLAATAAIPDEIELSYSYPADQAASDQQGRVDTVTTTSKYFLNYPALNFTRKPPPGGLAGSVSLKVPPTTIPAQKTVTSSCGNSPSRPSYSPQTTVGGGSIGGSFNISVPASCSAGYTTEEESIYIAAQRVEVRQTFYDGPAAQVGSTTSEITGPALEANSQYFADKYAYCVGTYANACLPNGACPLEGTQSIRLGRQITTYEYGTGNEVVKTVTSTYRPIISAAQPSDWRSGINRGIPQDFNGSLSLTSEYLHQVVITTYQRSNNENIQHTITYTSTATKGGGIGANINAYAGVKTEQIRHSTSTVTQDIRPDSVNAATTQVETDVTRVQMHGKVGGYTIDEAGPYIVKESVPVPLLLNSSDQVDDAVNAYGDYLARFIEGDARGLVIGESLRKSIATNWKPNMPFRYYDPKTGKFMAFRADACSWGVSVTGCVVAINGIWVADLLGSVSIPDNLYGNATPDMSGASDPTPPVNGGPIVEIDPGVDDEIVTGKRFNFFVRVRWKVGATCTPSGFNGIRPILIGRSDVNIHYTFIAFCTGMISSPGGLVTLNNDGSLPLESNGNPIVDEQNIVTADLFETP